MINSCTLYRARVDQTRGKRTTHKVTYFYIITHTNTRALEVELKCMAELYNTNADSLCKSTHTITKFNKNLTFVALKVLYARNQQPITDYSN